MIEGVRVDWGGKGGGRETEREKESGKEPKEKEGEEEDDTGKATSVVHLDLPSSIW